MDTPESKAARKRSRFDYVAYDADSQMAQGLFKDRFAELARAVETYPFGRAQSLVLTKLEEAYMWVGKMVRDQQIARTGQAPLQENRNPVAVTPPPADPL